MKDLNVIKPIYLSSGEDSDKQFRELLDNDQPQISNGNNADDTAKLDQSSKPTTPTKTPADKSTFQSNNNSNNSNIVVVNNSCNISNINTLRRASYPVYSSTNP